MLRTRKGFTLIELLIVVVIIGILAAIAIPKFANTKSKAYVTAMKSDLRNLVTAEEAFFSDSSRYTATITDLKYQNSSGTVVPTITTGAFVPDDFWNLSFVRSVEYDDESEKNASSAVTRLRRSDFIAVTYAFDLVFANFGIAIAARMPMMTTTMSSSISVKPLRLESIQTPVSVEGWCSADQPGRSGHATVAVTE